MTEASESLTSNWTEAYRVFEGTAQELAEALEAIAGVVGSAPDDPEPSERLVRSYVQKGALDRPERRGKESIYGFRQIAQYFAVRRLLSDGWPLALAAQETATRDTAELLELIGAESPGGAAQADARIGSPAALEGRRSALTERLSRASQARALLGVSETASAEARPVMRLALTPWASLAIDADRVDKITEAEADALGALASAALIEARLRRGGG